MEPTPSPTTQPPAVTFDSVIRFLQEQALSSAHERTQSAAKIFTLEDRVTTLDKENRFLQSINQTLLQRVKMLELTLDNERRATAAALSLQSREGGGDDGPGLNGAAKGGWVASGEGTMQRMTPAAPSTDVDETNLSSVIRVASGGDDTDSQARPSPGGDDDDSSGGGDGHKPFIHSSPGQPMRSHDVSSRSTPSPVKTPTKPSGGSGGSKDGSAQSSPMSTPGQSHAMSLSEGLRLLSSSATGSGAGAREWSSRQTLRSHFDTVRSLSFHEGSLPLLASGSEDATIKLWNLATITQKRTAARIDLEPIFTYRGHSGPIYTSAIHGGRGLLASAGGDCSVRVWGLPEEGEEPYGCTGGSIRHQVSVLDHHRDAVWDVALHPNDPLVISASSDGTVVVAHEVGGLAQSGRTMSLQGKNLPPHTPTCVAVIPARPGHIAVAFTSGIIVIFDIDTGAPVLHIDILSGPVTEAAAAAHQPRVDLQPNSMIAHSTLPLLLSAHADGVVRVFDATNGSVVAQLEAHNGGASDISVDRVGTCVVSCGVDASVKFWDIGARSCLESFTNTHARKLGDSATCVCVDPGGSMVASGGGDAVVKLYR